LEHIYPSSANYKCDMLHLLDTREENWNKCKKVCFNNNVLIINCLIKNCKELTVSIKQVSVEFLESNIDYFKWNIIPELNNITFKRSFKKCKQDKDKASL